MMKRSKRRRVLGTCVMFCLMVMNPWAELLAREVPIVILHTTDLHAHLLPTRDYDGNEDVGGLLRCATAIERVREEHPHVMLLDGGDLYQGTMAGYMTRGRIMNDALAWLEYDAWVLGNHEFDWGVDTLAETLRHGTVPVLGANVTVRPGAVHPLDDVLPFVIRDVDGVRVAVVGLTTDAIPTWSRPHLLGDVVIKDSVETLRIILPEVRALRPDIMVLLMHQGYRSFGDNPANQVNRIARKFPEFDVMIGGHSHQPIESARVNDILYSQAGYHGVWLGKINLVYDTVARQLVRRDARLVHVGDAYEPHQGLWDVVRADLERAEQAGAVQIGDVAETVDARSGPRGQSGIQTLICRAIAEAAEADIVLHGAFSGEILSAGPVYERDIWRIVPYENTIGVVHLTPAEIKAVLEDNAELMAGSHFMGVYGIRYDLHAYADPGRRVRQLRRADGSRIHPRKRLRVAMNSYVLASGGQRFPAARRLADDPLTRLEMTDVDTRAAVRDYIKRNSPIAIEVEEAVNIRRSRK